MQRGFTEEHVFNSGLYMIQVNGKTVQTYCDFDRHGGGWTLVTKRSTGSGWTTENSVLRNPNDASQNDYSIFKFVDVLKQKDAAEVCHILDARFSL